jgi:ribonuclease E
MKRMLINATQAEERRLAIVDGQKLSTSRTNSLTSNAQGQHYQAVGRASSRRWRLVSSTGEDRHGFLPFMEHAPFFRDGVEVGERDHQRGHP